jgi:hypothetical protein
MKYLPLLLLLFAACSKQPLPKPYNELKTVLPYDEHGWYANKRPMKQLIRDYDVKVVIEVGSWLGQSTRHIAGLLPQEGKVYAVDHWQGSLEHQPGQATHGKDLRLLYDQFLSNVIHAKLTDKIVPVRMPSVEAAKALTDVKPDLVYIDASHEFEPVYQDLTAWFPYVKGHGILCGDDWAYPEVQKAVEKFAGENGLKIETQISVLEIGGSR